VRWSPAKRILFRFLCSYFVLYLAPFPLDAIPGLGEIVAPPYASLWNAIVTWVGKHLFGIAITVLPNGSGDTTYNYVQVLCFLVLAVTATAVWSLLDRRRESYQRLFVWLRVYVRFSLAITMISYGAVKVVPSQFPNPTLDRMLQPFGDSSPMGILWTLMGTSLSYNVFGGLSEMLGGLLLLARRTTLLGALVLVAVLGNVVMLNFSYDVPVKLFSLHLLAMAVVLAAPDARRLADVLLLNRPAPAAEVRPLFGRKWLDRGALVLRTVFVVGFAVLSLQNAHETSKRFGNLSPRSPLRGVWEVERFAIDGQDRPPLVTDPLRWRRVVFDQRDVIGVQSMNDSRQRYTLQRDPSTQTFVLHKRGGDPSWTAHINYKQTAPGVLAVEGTFDGHQIRAWLRRTETGDFPLLSRGFHWINEHPFNR
jgi:hypothetical protein